MQRDATRRVQGVLYKCRQCDWEGEKSYGLEHLARKHQEPAPYHCQACDVGMSSERHAKIHEGQQGHKRKTKLYKGYPISYDPTRKLEPGLKVCSRDQKHRILETRGEGTGNKPEWISSENRCWSTAEVNRDQHIQRPGKDRSCIYCRSYGLSPRNQDNRRNKLNWWNPEHSGNEQPDNEQGNEHETQEQVRKAPQQG